MQKLPEAAPVTAILDAGVLPPPRPKKRALGVVIGVIIGFVIGIVYVAAIENAGNSEPQSNLALLSYFAILALVVVIHELGHLAAGWLVGFHFSRVSVGPFSFKTEYGRLKVQVRRDLGVLGYAGMHIETVRKMRRHLLVFIGAGPAANLISGTLATLLAYSAPTALRNTWVVPFAAGFWVLSFVTAGLSLIPYGATVRSDGARIWMLLTSRESARRWMASCALGSQQRKGIRAKYWKQTWLNAVCSVRDGRPDELAGNLLAYVAASDRKDAVASAVHLERLLALARSPQTAQRDFIAREASFFCAWYRDDLPLAERWLSQVRRPKVATRLQQIRTDIALDCARHNFDAAVAQLQKGAEFIKQLPETRVKRLLQESWQEWNEEIRQKQCHLATA